jgi:hypothetical protein
MVAVDVPGVYVELDSAGGRLAFYRADLMAGVSRRGGKNAGDDNRDLPARRTTSTAAANA